MKAVEFNGQTRLLGPPPGWDNERDGDCGALPVRIEQNARGWPATFTSYWRPSADDLAALNSGAHVRLTIVGHVHPPVAVSVERAEELP